jgi:hypothetical protein
MLDFPEPTAPAASRSEVFLHYLDYFRETLLEKAASMPAASVASSGLPSGWTPLQLLKHVRFVEMRWIEWGFRGGNIGDPWGDRRDERWYVGPDETLASLADELRAQGEHTRKVVLATDLEAIGAPGPRWDGADPASLERVLFHLVQEYARHAGHLDIVAELAGGVQGE